MIPKIAKGGRSFKGAFAYYGHDKHATTRDRIAWTQTRNMLTENPDRAWKVMAYTAKEQDRLKEAAGQTSTGRRLERPVFSYSLAWHPEQAPNKEEMLQAAQESLESLDLTDYETLIIAHRDEPQKHVHIIVNRVHPITGIAAKLPHSKRRLSEFARQYEEKHGKIYCQQRLDNHQRKTKGETTVYRDLNISDSWHSSSTGKDFQDALAQKGYRLAQGRKRIVVVDPQGKVHAPARHIEGIRAADVTSRLRDIHQSELPDATDLSQEIQRESGVAYNQARHFEAEQALLLNRLQDRHIEERSRLNSRHLDLISTERFRLGEYYKLEEQAEEIDSLRQKAGRHGIWSRVVNTITKVRERLEKAERNLENAQARLNNRIQSLEEENKGAFKQLAEYQREDMNRFQEMLASRQPTQTSTARSDEKERLRTRSSNSNVEELRLDR